MDKLFVYGTLQPGGPNEHIMTAIDGTWEPAIIKGTLQQTGWGAEMGYPGLLPDENGDEIPGYIFSSPNLNAKWADMDKFEGADYQRILAPVILQNGETIQAYVYVLRP